MPLPVRARQLAGRGQWAEVVRLCRRWCEQEPTNPEAHDLLASALCAAGDREGAVREHYRATFYYWERRWLKRALAEAREGLDIDGYYPPLRRVVSKLVCAEAAGGRSSEVLRSMAEWVTQTPNALLPHFFLGQCHRSQGLHRDAIREYRMALRANDLDPDPYRGLAATYRSQEQYGEARANLQIAAAVAPGRIETDIERARLRLAQGTHAEDELSALLDRLGAPEVDTRIAVADFVRELGSRSSDAAIAYELALELEPQNPEALRGLAMVRKFR